MMFAAIRIITNRIWTSVIFHFLFDLQIGIINIGFGESSWIDIIAIFLPLLFISLVLIISVNKSIEKNKIKELEV